MVEARKARNSVKSKNVMPLFDITEKETPFGKLFADKIANLNRF